MNNDAEITQRVKSLLSERDITPYKLAKECSIPHSSMSFLMNDKLGWKLDFLIKVADYFDVNLDWLIKGIGVKGKKDSDPYVREVIEKYSSIKVQSVPVVGSIGCGMPMMDWEDYGNKYVEMVKIGHLNNPFVLKASGDSMSPYIEPGDYLLCSDNPEKLKDGKAAVISFNSQKDEAMGNVKIVSQVGEKKIALFSINTKYKPAIYHKSAIYKIYPLIRIIREVK